MEMNHTKAITRYGDRIRELRQDKEVNIKYLDVALDISSSDYMRIEKALLTPSENQHSKLVAMLGNENELNRLYTNHIFHTKGSWKLVCQDIEITETVFKYLQLFLTSLYSTNYESTLTCSTGIILKAKGGRFIDENI